VDDESGLTTERLDELDAMAREAKERAGKATAGPWRFAVLGPRDSDSMCLVMHGPREGWIGHIGSGCADDPRHKANAEHIAHAREDVPALAGALLEVTAEVRRLRAAGDVKAIARTIALLIGAEPGEEIGDAAVRLRHERDEARKEATDLMVRLEDAEADRDGVRAAAQVSREIASQQREACGRLDDLAARLERERDELRAEVWRLREEATRPAPRSTEEQEAMDIVQRAAGSLRANDELRAEIERLRAVEAEWQRVTGYGAPERFPGYMKRIDVPKWHDSAEPRALTRGGRDDSFTVRAREAASAGPARPDVSPEAVASVAARFDAADPKWHRLLDEVKRRHLQEAHAVVTSRLSTAQATQLDARGWTPVVAWVCDRGTWIEADPLHVEFLRAEASGAEGTPQPVAQDGSSVAQAAPNAPATALGVDLGGPATFAAARLVRQPDGSFRPLAMLEGEGAARPAEGRMSARCVDGRPWSADAYPGLKSVRADADGYWLSAGPSSGTSSREEATPDDGRWAPGAAWEHECGGVVRRMEISSVDSSNTPVARLRVQGTWSALQSVPVSEMTEANGWRFIGRAEEDR
jgi:hypothetical protein